MAASANANAALTEPQSRLRHTFAGNHQSTRHGWLRLTPAYSVRLVSELLDGLPRSAGPVLDPFCGTGTTLLSCSERGFDCDTTDINPFLVWLALTKTRNYSARDLAQARAGLARSVRRARDTAAGRGAWLPPLHQIEKWWSEGTLSALGRAHAALERFAESASARAGDLLRVAFCRALIEHSHADFGHQSMSFASPKAAAGARRARADAEALAVSLEAALERIAGPARERLPRTRRRALALDAKLLHERLPARHYGAVITSPPYANRMSYVRELRPYMYWLKYLEDRKGAGVLDWRAIGGTWGSATSNLASWAPSDGAELAPDMEARLAAIAAHSPLLSTYVRKYLHDMRAHLSSVERVLRRGASVHYVIGNSKFYDVVVPVQDWLAVELEQLGFARVGVRCLRKRTSKKELFEYVVSGER